MELEPFKKKAPFSPTFLITLFLYGIGAYIYFIRVVYLTIIITLFLYGIGAQMQQTQVQTQTQNYIIPIWNWSFNTLSLLSLPTLLHYSYMELEHAFYFVECWMWINYIISIWNWSFASRYFWYNSTYITLFLYGIGAML